MEASELYSQVKIIYTIHEWEKTWLAFIDSDLLDRGVL